MRLLRRRQPGAGAEAGGGAAAAGALPVAEGHLAPVLRLEDADEEVLRGGAGVRGTTAAAPRRRRGVPKFAPSLSYGEDFLLLSDDGENLRSRRPWVGSGGSPR